MNAKEASLISDMAIKEGTNYQRKYCLDRIANAAQYGKKEIQFVEGFGFYMFEDDWQYLESLGYKVNREYWLVSWE